MARYRFGRSNGVPRHIAVRRGGGGGATPATSRFSESRAEAPKVSVCLMAMPGGTVYLTKRSFKGTGVSQNGNRDDGEREGANC